MAKKKTKPPGTEHTYYLMPDGRIMKNPGLTEELTDEEMMALSRKGWKFNIPKVNKKKVVSFKAIEPPPDDYYLLYPMMG